MYSVSYPDLPHSSLKALKRNSKYKLTYLVYFSMAAVSPTHSGAFLQPANTVHLHK